MQRAPQEWWAQGWWCWTAMGRWNARSDPAARNTYYVNERTGVSRGRAAPRRQKICNGRRRELLEHLPSQHGRRRRRGGGVLPAGGLGAARA